MSERIQEGKRVLLQYSWPNEGGAKQVVATLVHTPSGPGDMFYVVLPDGTRQALNPYHYAFVGFEEISEKMYERLVQAAGGISCTK